MSLLSATQGTPERVLSLIQVLAAHGGALPRGDLMTWLNPPFSRNGVARATGDSASDQTLTAANDLGLVSLGQVPTLTPGAETLDLPALTDVAHDQLVTAGPTDADGVLLRAFAYVVAACEKQQGASWLRGDTAGFVNAVNDALPKRAAAQSDALRFNPSKVAPLWRWLAFVGLSRDLPDMAYPYVTARLDRELRRAGLKTDTELPIRDVLSVIAQRMPYLDGGALFADAAAHLGLPAMGRALSPVLSVALRDLDEEGRLELGARRDAAGLISLSSDPFSKVSAVQYVVLRGGDDDA